MKILFCPTHYVLDDGERGSELSWAYQIADGIASKNPGSIVVTGFNNTKSKKKYKIVELQRDKKTIDLGVVNALKFNLAYTKYTNNILKKEKIEVLHHVLPFSIDNTFNVSFMLPVTKNILKIIGPIQSPLPFYKDNIHDYKSKPKNDIYDLNRLIQLLAKPILKYLSTLTMKKSDKIIAINEEAEKLLIDRGIDKNKIVIIPPGIDSQKFSFKTNNTIKKNIEILSVGALIERKGFDVLIKAIAEVVKMHKNIKVRIVGDGPQKKNLKNLVKKLFIGKYIIFSGHIPHNEMTKYYRNADIFVSMSRAESWGQMYLEAMASGLPIVSSINSGSKNIIIDNKIGFLIKQEDYYALSKKIAYLIGHPNIMKQFSERARVEVQRKYDWKDIIIKKYISLYNNNSLIYERNI